MSQEDICETQNRSPDRTCGKGGLASLDFDKSTERRSGASRRMDCVTRDRCVRFRRSGLRAPKAPAPGSRRAPFSASSASYDLDISPMARPAAH